MKTIYKNFQIEALKDLFTNNNFCNMYTAEKEYNVYVSQFMALKIPKVYCFLNCKENRNNIFGLYAYQINYRLFQHKIEDISIGTKDIKVIVMKDDVNCLHTFNYNIVKPFLNKDFTFYTATNKCNSPLIISNGKENIALIMPILEKGYNPSSVRKI